MIARVWKAVVLLPGTTLVLIPVLLLYSFRQSSVRHSLARPEDFQFWIALVIGIFGISLAVWTVSLFVRFGQGTPAPWDPPKKLIVKGPYCYVRNPMIIAVFFILFAEALMLGSWPIFGWFVAFKLINAFYIPLFEEKKLESRFGESYRAYKLNVPRWLPRSKAWKGN